MIESFEIQILIELLVDEIERREKSGLEGVPKLEALKEKLIDVEGEFTWVFEGSTED